MEHGIEVQVHIVTYIADKPPKSKQVNFPHVIIQGSKLSAWPLTYEDNHLISPHIGIKQRRGSGTWHDKGRCGSPRTIICLFKSQDARVSWKTLNLVLHYQIHRSISPIAHLPTLQNTNTQTHAWINICNFFFICLEPAPKLAHLVVKVSLVFPVTLVKI